jgi:hypothetical protein
MLPKDKNPTENLGLREEAKYLADGLFRLLFHRISL